MPVTFKKYYDNKQIKNVKVTEHLWLDTRPDESLPDPDEYDILTRNRTTGIVERLSAIISITETDPVAIAKTITLNAGIGITIAETPTQTLGSNPSWTISSSITQYTDAMARMSISAVAPISFNNITGVITHDTSGVSPGTYNNITVDAYGHATFGSNVAYLTSFTETDPVAIAKTITLTQGSGITITGTASQTLGSNPSWTVSHTDTSSVSNLDTSGAEIIDTLTFDTFGHVQTVTTRTLTLSDLGYTPVSYTVNNGLTASTSTNFQLGSTSDVGSPLLHDTYINTDATFALNIKGSKTTPTGILIVENTSLFGTAIKGISDIGMAVVGASNGGYGVRGTSSAGPGVSGSSSSTSGIEGTSETGYAGYFQVNPPASTNTTVKIIGLTRSVSGTAGNGIGGYLEYSIPTITDNRVSNQLISKWTNVTDASRVSEFSITGVNAATTATLFTLSGSGSTRLNKYGVGTFVASPAYSIGVDSSGNLIEYTAAAGGLSAITADNGLTATTISNVQLGGTLLHDTTINTVSYRMLISGTIDGSAVPIVEINNSTTLGGIALKVVNASPFQAAIFASGNAFAISATGNTGIYTVGTAIGLQTESYLGGLPFIASGSKAGTNTVSTTAKFATSTTGTAANGLGHSIDFYTQSSTGGSALSNQIITKWTDATHATRTSRFIITGVNSSVTADLFTISGNGVLTGNKYGVGTFVATPTYAIGVDSSGNLVEFAVGSGGATYTVNNGLTASTSTNFQLGGTGIQNTNIDWSNFTFTNTWNTLSGSGLTLSSTSTAATGNAQKVLNISLSGVNATSTQFTYGVYSINTHTGTNSKNVGVYGEASGGTLINYGVQGVTSTGTGVYGFSASSGRGVLGSSDSNVGVEGGSNSNVGGNFYSTSHIGLQASSTSYLSALFSITPSTTNSVDENIRVMRLTSGTPTDGIGTSIDYYISNAVSTFNLSNKLISKWTTVATSTRTSQFIIAGVNSAITADILTLSGNGAARLNKYGIGTFTGAAAYNLQVDSSGNIIEGTLSGGGLSSITADNGLTANTSSNVQLGGTTSPGRALLHDTYIDNNGYTLTLTSAASATSFSVINTGSAYSTLITAPYGLFVTSTNNGVVISAGDRPLQAIVTGDGYPASLLRTYNNTNTVNGVLALGHDTSGVAANGFGASIDIALATSTAAVWNSTKIISKWTDATTATRTSQIELWCTGTATSAVKFIIKGSGVINIPTGATNYADNAAALAGGLVAGDLYRIGDFLAIVH